jgi:hypothetical protein
MHVTRTGRGAGALVFSESFGARLDGLGPERSRTVGLQPGGILAVFLLEGNLMNRIPTGAAALS